MTATIRPVRAAEAETLAALHATSFARPWDANEFSTFLAQSTCDALIADAPRPAGLILVRTVADESEILTLAVEPAMRRSGLASRLLSAALTRMIDRGARACYLEVAADNTPALALYRKSLFEPSSTRRGYYPRDGGAVDAVTMRRILKII